MNKHDLFEKAYLNIISEQMQSDKKERFAPIDDLTKQNIATIDEEDQTPQDNVQNKQETTSETQVQVTNEQPEDENEVDQNDQWEDEDGWGQDVEQQFSDVLDDIDSLSYQIKNCVRGAYTKCNTKQELAQYIKSLAERLNQAAENL